MFPLIFFIDINKRHLLCKLIVLFNILSDINAVKYRALCMSCGYELAVRSSHGHEMHLS